MLMKEWTLKDAETHFAEVYSAAQTAPQVITDGTTTVVVQRKDDVRPVGTASEPKKVFYKGQWRSLVEMLLARPHKEGFEFERAPPAEPREIEF